MNVFDRRIGAAESQDTYNPSQTVMALHCSGADRTQWKHLSDYLGQNTGLILPNLVGVEAEAQGWTRLTYTLAEEAKPLIKLLRLQPTPVHLVGHSYGGALALHIARYHPELVASLCVYEPTSFSLLQNAGSDCRVLFDEIETLAMAIEGAVTEGFPDYAAQVFTDFWGGVGAWQALSRNRRAALSKWIPKCHLDFGALLYEPSNASLPSGLPMTVLVGSQSQRQTQRIAELLTEEEPQTRLITVNGAGHLGPFTFRDQVARIIGGHFGKVCEMQRNR